MGRVQRKNVHGEPQEVTAYFTEMLELHLASGRKSVRDIAKALGGEVSHSTVHRAFRGSQLPTTFRIPEQIVKLLDQGKLSEIRALWVAAVRAVEALAGPGDSQAAVIPHQPEHHLDSVDQESPSSANPAQTGAVVTIPR